MLALDFPDIMDQSQVFQAPHRVELEGITERNTSSLISLRAVRQESTKSTKLKKEKVISTIKKYS